MGLLDDMARSARARLPDLPRGTPAPPAGGPSFADALRGRDRLSVVAEVKRMSPSLGAIAPDADAVARARSYAAAGAAAISVLTEPTRFGGSLADLEAVAAAVCAPVLMKDFVVDPEQVRAGALLGARAVLVIRRMLEPPLLDEVLSACADHGLTPLFECHDAPEVADAVARSVPVVGVNNRDLETLEIDRASAPALMEAVPGDRVVVAESGYLEPGHCVELRGRCDAVLVGSALMTADDPAAFIREVAG